MQRIYSIGLIGAFASFSTVLYALLKKNNFYNACLFLSTTTFPLIVLLGTLLYLVVLLSLAARHVIFGTLRSVEVEHIWENGYISVSEIFLAMTIFREDFNFHFASDFLCLLMVKTFHWIFKDRVDLMEQTSNTQRPFMMRLLSALAVLVFIDMLGLGLSGRDFMERGPSISILFVTEYAILTIYLAHNVFKMICTLIDLSDENPWEEKSSYLFYAELVTDGLKLLVYIGFFALVTRYYGLPIHIIRDLYFTVKSFVTRIRDLIRYKTAVRNLQSKYPDATAEELETSGKICIICRDEMSSAKKLPCGHFFHLACLKSWIERQQVCPTCRRPIFQEELQPIAQPPAPVPRIQPIAPVANAGAGAETRHPASATAAAVTTGSSPRPGQMLPIILLPQGQIGVWNGANQTVSIQSQAISNGDDAQVIQRIEQQLYAALADLQRLKQRERAQTSTTE